MDTVRKPFQGVWNIVRFNWHFYLFAFLALIILFVLATAFESDLSKVFKFAFWAIIVINFISL